MQKILSILCVYDTLKELRGPCSSKEVSSFFKYHLSNAKTSLTFFNGAICQDIVYPSPVGESDGSRSSGPVQAGINILG